jgi:hypothetical protein
MQAFSVISSVNRPQAKSANAGRIYGLSLLLLYTKLALRTGVKAA